MSGSEEDDGTPGTMQYKHGCLTTMCLRVNRGKSVRVVSSVK